MIDKLEYFIALAGERHFGRAAERLGVTQPTLSAGIRQLEERLGVTLVNRGSRFQSLTAEGERVLVWARRIIGDVRTMQDELRIERQGLSGHLRLAVIPTALAVVSRLTTPFLERHPHVTFEILSRTSAEIAAGIDNFEIDLGITYRDEERPQRLDRRVLYAERYCLVTTRGNPFAERRSVTWDEAASIPLCLLTTTMQNRRILESYLQRAPERFGTVLESNSMIALIAQVRTGRFATIMPSRSAEMLGLAEPVRSIPLEAPDVSYDVALVRAVREPQPPLVASFWEEAALVTLR
ncbi:LysR family transcriptional regulator [Aurantimonas sp. MSK8Z-1]|uniref:LysR family transcriptional regulator n=1 Tax=Mangrovibrevibacter kandeliae TaxID=2968473 RepID=UPI002117F41C|nr:LysR family transcriptional regulator [Aurantimonas sp. MSK8Z-1]MCW4116136.1 LysR family transcriptional regulator [Aurantimonas sp. MSK8Z-1]